MIEMRCVYDGDVVTVSLLGDLIPCDDDDDG